MTTATPIDRLRAALLDDEAAQLQLAPVADTAAFLDAITAYAAGLGLPISREAFAAGLARAATPQMLQELPALRLPAAPPRQWLPVELKDYNGGIVIEWLHFAGLPLTDPFFDDTWRKVQHLPFNRLMRCATPFSAIDAFVGAPAPDGLVFHMSRCGSTLAGQMLGAEPGHIVAAEPPIVDTVIQLVGRGILLPAAIHAMAGAVMRDRTGQTRHRFIKVDAWHALVLPLLRRVWPDTPWTFLYRDPIEVLVSQQRRPGMHCRPGVLPLEAYGIDPAEGAASDDYAAWILNRICGAAANAVDGDCLLVNYDSLPAALTDAILPHFGIEPDEAARAAIIAAGGRYSKAPDRAFTGDSAAKQRAASPELRAVAAPLLATYARIEALRRERAPGEPAIAGSSPVGQGAA